MAAFETTYIPAHGASFAGRLNNNMRRMIAAYKTWNDARSTRKVLSGLTDRQLDDIGLCRADIERF